MVKIKNVMKKRVITAEKDTTIYTISKMMLNNRIGSVVIVDKRGKPIDIITTDDVVTLIAKNIDPYKAKVSDALKLKKKELITASPDDNLMAVAKKMIKNGVKRMPIVDRHGNLVGIISDKEVLLVSPELIEILSEKIKMRVNRVAKPDEKIAGICEECGEYSDELTYVDGRWLCSECIEKMVSQ